MKIKNKERTLAIVKPDGMVYLDEIIEAIYKEGFTIKDFYLKYLDKEILKEHYAHLIDKPFFPELVDYMTSDKVAILLLEGDNIVERFRKLIGPTDSRVAGPETIRGKYGTDKSINVIHGSSSREEAIIEIERFFKDRRKQMKNELIIKKCQKCGALVEVINDCNCSDCGITCCGEPMVKLISNSVDASFEKHIPTFELRGDEILVKVNHVMEKEHFIEWIALVNDKDICKVRLLPEQNAECKFKYIKGSKLYAYCNKHGLWSCDVE